ncbi:hypothetical protein MKW98_006013 [Papaver atlanticum]|uniref:Fe2OG dioxygenase domain-containing protein n=1 Tax=Papaver atlanticum TaxID=357466 RepID=A0AAD4S778_9MAGN|nr:hypothetical protein MKW98_006013 [Papaver atlanticum]
MLSEKEVEQITIPVIDFSFLTSGSPDQRCKIIQDLRNACRDWGFFMFNTSKIITLINCCATIVGGESWSSRDFEKGFDRLVYGFLQSEPEEKLPYRGKYELDPRIILDHETNFDTKVDNVSFWRDQFRVFVHPIFHPPHKPEGLSEDLSEYSKRSRVIMKELLRGIMEGLEFEEDDIEKSLELKSGDQIFSANFNPPCPQPELAIGLPPHADHGLLTLLIQNNVDGLHIKNKGKWVAVNPIPNSIMVNTGDHMDTLSKGKYKSVLHRAVVNNKETRISLVITNGSTNETAAT